jgi:uncharacterized tellurite resistance protein B-like protein
MMEGPAPPPVAAPDAAPSLEEAVATMRELLRTVVEADGTVTEQERLEVEKIMTAVQALAAGREKEKQAAMGGSPGTAYLRRQLGGV